METIFWEWCCHDRETDGIDFYDTLSDLVKREEVTNLHAHEGCDILLRRQSAAYGMTDEWNMGDLERIVKYQVQGDIHVPQRLLKEYINIRWADGDRPELPEKRRAELTRTKRMDRQRDRIDATNHLKATNAKETVNICNTSLWPNEVVRLLVNWVFAECDRLGFKSKMNRHSSFKLTHTSTGARGRCWDSYHVLVRHDRAHPRKGWKYVGIKHAPDNRTNTALTSLLYILTHEILHTTDIVQRVRHRNGALRRQKFEVGTERRVAEIVSRFIAAQEDATIWKKYAAGRRRTRKTLARQAEAATKKKAEKDSPEFRISHAEAKAAEWAKKAERAKKAAQKWKTKANRIRGAQRAAATRAANG